MVTIIWEYVVKTDRIADFEKIYEPNGEWAKLFKKGKGFIGTKLARSPNDPKQFVTVDQWESMLDYKSFLMQWKDE